LRSPLSRERWTKVQSLFVAAAELPPEQRRQLVEEQSQGDEELRDEVFSLLRYDSSGPDIQEAVEQGARSILTNVRLEGTLLGPWRVERELGRGGMSVVYLAIRADGQFSRRVAIKVIKRGMDTAAVVERFQRERRILAALDHPYIARLLDGGTTADGLPYIVMDYVEGLPINDWCDERGLGVEQRCELIAKVCDAVAYAHRNLVIHRDLKPGNVLVGPDGNPKLLDFGIAKVLGDGFDRGETLETRIPLRALTPEYASPEQVAGSVVGTSTDVYSLGVVLFELLAGSRPQSGEEKVSAAALRSGRNARWVRRVGGDLDTILHMALRAEPERRYLSVEKLGKDLRSYLAGLPVEARDESLVYRCGKFMRRHRIGTLAAGLMVVSIVAGVTSTLWQARKAQSEKQIAEARRAEAEQEREIARTEATKSAAARLQAEDEHAEADRQRSEAEAQKRIAESARERAERNFQQTREMAGKFLFDFHDSIANLTGATPARKLAVDTGLRYYDLLLKDAAGNRELLKEIARGYDRLGDVQGNIYFSNLGDIPGSEASYRKALAIRDGIADPSPEFLMDRMRGYVRLGQAMLGKDDYGAAARYFKLALALGEDGPAAPFRQERDIHGQAWSLLGDALAYAGARGEAIAAYSRMLALRLQIAHDEGGTVGSTAGVATAHVKLAEQYELAGRRAEALEHAQPALDGYRSVAAADPASIPKLRVVCIATIWAARLVRAGVGEDVFPRLEVGRQLDVCAAASERMIAADPDNRRALFDLAYFDVELGDWQQGENDRKGAAATWNRGVVMLRKLADTSTAGASANEQIFVQLYRRLADSATDSKGYGEALEDLTQAENYAAALEKQQPDSLICLEFRAEIARARADVYMAQKLWPNAISEVRASITANEAIAMRDPENQKPLSETAADYIFLARCLAESGRRQDGLSAVNTAMDRYAAITSRRALDPAEERRRTEAQTLLADWKGR